MVECVTFLRLGSFLSLPGLILYILFSFVKRLLSIGHSGVVPVGCNVQCVVHDLNPLRRISSLRNVPWYFAFAVVEIWNPHAQVRDDDAFSLSPKLSPDGEVI